MKIAAYNIMSGGFSSYISTVNKPERLRELQKAIQTIKADFIGLIDTFRWVEVLSAQDLKNLFGYREAFHINMDDVRVDKRIGVAVLTNLPVRTFQSVRLHTRKCIKAEVNFKKKVLNIFTIYLDDLSEETRLQQAHALLKQVTNHSTILMGDFNALHPEDVAQSKATCDAFLKANPSFKSRKDYRSYFVPVLESMYQTKVVPLVRSRGFLEAVNHGQVQPTVPTPLFLKIPSPIFKIDYIFSTPDLMLNKLRVLKGGIFDETSDHYPIICEVSFGGS